MMMKKNNLKALFAIIILTPFISGCAGSRHAKVPDAWNSMEWKGSSHKSLNPKAPHAFEKLRHTDKWWVIFNDDALSNLEEKAISANYNLEEAIMRVERFKSLLQSEKADLFPSIDATGEAQRSRTASRDLGTFRTQSFTGENYFARLEANYELDIWGKIRDGIKAAKYDLLANEYAKQDVFLTLTTLVAENYFKIRALDIERNLLEESVELRKESLNLVLSKQASGVVSQLDSARARTQLAEAGADIIEVERRRKIIENELALLTGQSASLFTLESNNKSLTFPLVPVHIPSKVIQKRPDIKEAESLLEKSAKIINITYKSVYPSIRLSANAGFQNTTTETLFESDSRIWSVTPKVSIPLFHGFKNKALIKAAKADYKEKMARYRQTILNAFTETENALTNIELLIKHSEMQNKVVDAAEETAKISLDRYRNGLIDFFEVADAERSRLIAKSRQVQLSSERMNAALSLIKAVGGNWQEDFIPDQ